MKKVLENLLNIIDFIFYRSYKNEIKKWAGVPKAHAVIQVSFVFVLIVLNLTLITEIIFNIKIFRAINQNQTDAFIIGIIAVLIACFVYFIYFNNKRYLKILKKFDNIEKEKRKQNNLRSNLFIISSLVLTVILIIILAQNN